MNIALANLKKTSTNGSLAFVISAPELAKVTCIAIAVLDS